MKKGFFIIEFLVYLVLFSCIMFLFMQLVVSKSGALKGLQETANNNIELIATLDLIVRILEQAPGELSAYKIIEPSRLIWRCRKDAKDKGFIVEKGELFFIEGIYSKENAGWQRKRRTRLIPDIDDVVFTLIQQKLHQKKWVRVITVALQYKNKKMAKSVALYNRAVA